MCLLHLLVLLRGESIHPITCSNVGLQNIKHEVCILAEEQSHHVSEVTIPKLFKSFQPPPECSKHTATIFRCWKHLPLTIGEHILVKFQYLIDIIKVEVASNSQAPTYPLCLILWSTLGLNPLLHRWLLLWCSTSFRPSDLGRRLFRGTLLAPPVQLSLQLDVVLGGGL